MSARDARLWFTNITLSPPPTVAARFAVAILPAMPPYASAQKTAVDDIEKRQKEVQRTYACAVMSGEWHSECDDDMSPMLMLMRPIHDDDAKML